MTQTDHYEFKDISYFRFGYSPIGRPTLYAYIYFVDGLLIDTGQRRMGSNVLKTLSSLPVEQIFITHHHEDHTGNINMLRDHFECPVYAPELCCEIMKNPPPISFAQWAVWGSRPANTTLLPLSDQVKTSNYTFEQIPITGHAQDMVALYEPERKWLFSADLYINSYIGYFMKDESIDLQIQSLRKVLNLDFNELFCSHNPQLQGGRQQLEKKLYYLEDFNDRVSSLYHKGHTAQEVFKILKLKEHGYTHLISHGHLSKMNMVRSVFRDQGQ